MKSKTRKPPPDPVNAKLFSLLSSEQRAVIRDYPLFMTGDPDCFDKENLRAALDSYWSE